MVSGETSDISQFCKLEWFKWIIFSDETAPFSYDVLKLGHYPGPINVDPDITTAILIQNEQVLHRLTNRLLTPDEIADIDR